MAHALAFPTHSGSRHTGQARFDLDGTRIAASAGAIVINTVALMLLLAPVALLPPVQLSERVTDVIWVRPKPEPEPIVIPVEPKPEPRQPTAAAQPRAAPTSTPRPAVDSQPGDEALPAIDSDVDPGDATGLVPPWAAGAPLRSISAPSPAYPPAAIRGGLTGTVELEILVGIDGAPLEVRILRSSGHRLLDQAARKIVLSHWRFQPAMRDGRPVQALGRVPIAFTLDR